MPSYQHDNPEAGILIGVGIILIIVSIAYFLGAL